MKTRLDNILIGILWLLAATLGACFWFNVRYGFNIFSFRHWQYLAYLQASQQPVDPSFYISIIVIVFIAVAVLYLLFQPKRRNIVLPVMDVHNNTQPTITAIPVQQPTTHPVIQQSEQSVVSPAAPVRPPRLNIPTINPNRPITPRVPLASTTSPKLDPEVEYADIHEIFTNAGFVYKGSPRVKGIQTSVVAIGADEVFWIGATGIKASDMKNIVNTIHGVFVDTLEDIEININAFVINASENDDDSILQFADIDELRDYISEHPNTTSDDDQESFDAYSAYIGTVIDYLGKM